MFTHVNCNLLSQIRLNVGPNEEEIHQRVESNALCLNILSPAMAITLALCASQLHCDM